jgi:hypothetical protein
MYKLFVGLAAIFVLSVSGCEPDNVNELGKGIFIDFGFIPNEVAVVAPFQSMIFSDGFVFVATSDGIWKCNLSDGKWDRSGLEGKSITSLFRHPDVLSKFFASVSTDHTSDYKTLYISTDGGSTWQEATNPIYDNINNCYENYGCFAVRPGYPQQVYANLSGLTIAISIDGGENWTRMNHAVQSNSGGYESNIAFLPGNGDTIFQGAEAWLDCAWLIRYEVNSSDPVILENFKLVIDEHTWGNRRPNDLQTFNYTGNNLYVGLEGALAKVTGTTNKFIFKSDLYDLRTRLDQTIQYSYIRALWVDPNNINHILFGGSLNYNVQPMQLYETYNEGGSIFRYSDKAGLENPMVCDIISTETYPAVLLQDMNLGKVKLLLLKHDN